MVTEKDVLSAETFPTVVIDVESLLNDSGLLDVHIVELFECQILRCPETYQFCRILGSPRMLNLMVCLLPLRMSIKGVRST